MKFLDDFLPVITGVMVAITVFIVLGMMEGSVVECPVCEECEPCVCEECGKCPVLYPYGEGDVVCVDYFSALPNATHIPGDWLDAHYRILNLSVR